MLQAMRCKRLSAPFPEALRRLFCPIKPRFKVSADLELVRASHVDAEADPKEAAHHGLECTASRFGFSG